MPRRLIRALLAVALRVFFRRIELLGQKQVPRCGPVVFVLNHPSGLVDPLLVLCFASRPASFLAKAPLFRMPLIGFFVRAFDSIPVYRRQDPGTDLSKNRETFEKARALLGRGGALALFPEGASHDEPKRLALKTGAARIALGAASISGSSAADGPLQIVPTGLYYTWKERFRSSVLVSFGDPILADRVVLDERGEPPSRQVRELTERIEAGLDTLTLQAESHEALALIRRAERIFSSEEAGESLASELQLRRRFVEGYARLKERDPERLAGMQARIARFEAERREKGLPLKDLTPAAASLRSLALLIGENLAALLLMPLAAAGAFLHYPAYRLAGFLATRFSRGEKDVLATLKVGAAMLLFPLTWIVCVACATAFAGAPAGLVSTLLAPLSGYAALRARESLNAIAGRARALLRFATRGYGMRRLLAERRAIREEIFRMAGELELIRPSESSDLP